MYLYSGVNDGPPPKKSYIHGLILRICECYLIQKKMCFGSGSSTEEFTLDYLGGSYILYIYPYKGEAEGNYMHLKEEVTWP